MAELRGSRIVFLGLLTTAALTSCAVETIVHNIDERQANKILQILADSDIDANKIVQDTGRAVTYSIAVPAGKRLDAIRVLNRFELPQTPARGYHEVFTEGGLIPTSTEEKAKKLAAIEGEIERQLRLFDDVLDVQVQIVMPDENALRTTREQEPDTTASVTIKYRPKGDSVPLTRAEVQQIVAGGVEKLAPEKVFVKMSPAVGFETEAGRAASGGAAAGLPMSKRQFTMAAAAVATLVLLLLLGLFYTQLRLKTVRERLGRLQTEISKARRRPEGTSSTSAPAP